MIIFAPKRFPIAVPDMPAYTRILHAMTEAPFLTPKQALALREAHGSPVFIYDEARLLNQADACLAFPHAFGLTVRYAMKALPTAAILRLFNRRGLHIDASSGYEAGRAMMAGIPADYIQITAQQLPDDLDELVRRGVRFTACSLHQLRTYGALFPNTPVSVRINPGLGTGHSNRTNVGGPSSSFGIWHEHLDEVYAVAAEFGLRITGMHTHIGSGGDPEVWVRCARMSLAIAAHMPEVTRLSLGGGYKVARMDNEVSADLESIGARLLPEFDAFAQAHGRKLHLEIEPGTFLVANAGALVCTVMDVVDTGAEGYRFIKVDAGMTEILRPSIYGAQHPIHLVPADDTPRERRDYLIAGHCCESGDILTPEPGNPEGLLPRSLPEARIGDALIVGGAGAYCASMASKNYNAYPECPEVLLRRDGGMDLIRHRQTLEQVVQNEVR